jgi:hypothetical protein
MNITKETLDHVFTYHAPQEDQPARYARVREGAKALAQIILDNAPDSRERSAALTDLQKVVHMTNAAIAING